MSPSSEGSEGVRGTPRHKLRASSPEDSDDPLSRSLSSSPTPMSPIDELTESKNEDNEDLHREESEENIDECSAGADLEDTENCPPAEGYSSRRYYRYPNQFVDGAPIFHSVVNFQPTWEVPGVAGRRRAVQHSVGHQNLVENVGGLIEAPFSYQPSSTARQFNIFEDVTATQGIIAIPVTPDVDYVPPPSERGARIPLRDLTEDMMVRKRLADELAGGSDVEQTSDPEPNNAVRQMMPLRCRRRHELFVDAAQDQEEYTNENLGPSSAKHPSKRFRERDYAPDNSLAEFAYTINPYANTEWLKFIGWNTSANDLGEAKAIQPTRIIMRPSEERLFLNEQLLSTGSYKKYQELAALQLDQKTYNLFSVVRWSDKVSYQVFDHTVDEHEDGWYKGEVEMVDAVNGLQVSSAILDASSNDYFTLGLDARVTAHGFSILQTKVESLKADYFTLNKKAADLAARTRRQILGQEQYLNKVKNEGYKCDNLVQRIQNLEDEIELINLDLLDIAIADHEHNYNCHIVIQNLNEALASLNCIWKDLKEEPSKDSWVKYYALHAERKEIVEQLEKEYEAIVEEPELRQRAKNSLEYDRDNLLDYVELYKQNLHECENAVESLEDNHVIVQQQAYLNSIDWGKSIMALIAMNKEYQDISYLAVLYAEEGFGHQITVDDLFAMSYLQHMGGIATSSAKSQRFLKKNYDADCSLTLVDLLANKYVQNSAGSSTLRSVNNEHHCQSFNISSLHHKAIEISQAIHKMTLALKKLDSEVTLLTSNFKALLHGTHLSKPEGQTKWIPSDRGRARIVYAKLKNARSRWVFVNAKLQEATARQTKLLGQIEEAISGAQQRLVDAQDKIPGLVLNLMEYCDSMKSDEEAGDFDLLDGFLNAAFLQHQQRLHSYSVDDLRDGEEDVSYG